MNFSGKLRMIPFAEEMSQLIILKLNTDTFFRSSIGLKKKKISKNNIISP